MKIHITVAPHQPHPPVKTNHITRKITRNRFGTSNSMGICAYPEVLSIRIGLIYLRNRLSRSLGGDPNSLIVRDERQNKRKLPCGYGDG